MTEVEVYKYINDEYTKRRGTPEMLVISCANCLSQVMLYQKDGPGPLIRCYWDRIHDPLSLKGLNRLKTFPNELICPNCSKLIGQTALYLKEKRLVFVLENESFRLHSYYIVD